MAEADQIEADSILLVLNQREAEALLALLYHVGGDPNGPRGDSEAVGTALREAGVARRRELIPEGSSIYMKDKW